MKIIIGEDDVLIAQHLKKILLGFNYEVVGMAHNKEDIIAAIDKNLPDIALLDIRMKGKFDGIEIGEYVLHRYHFPVIYITAHSDTEIVGKALKTKPSGYIKKPFNAIDINIAINIATENFAKSANTNALILKDGIKTIKLPYFKILFIKSDNNYSEIYTLNKMYVERISLSNMLSKLDCTKFVQIHRSYIVNTDHVNEFSSNALIIHKHCLPISRKYKKQLTDIMLDNLK